jgi:hypothetical protein
MRIPIFLLLAVAALAVPARVFAIIEADDAGDVCAASADPCVISDTVVVAGGAILDFGLRTLEIRPTGKLATGAVQATVRCGDLSAANPAGPSIDARGPGLVSELDGGTLTIEARGRCGANGAPCLRDGECGAASCTLGTGAVRLLGAARIDGGEAGVLRILAAGDVVIGGAIAASSFDADSDGGLVEISSFNGSVRIDSAIAAASGRSGQGGAVELSAAGDVSVNAEIDLSGGEFDGGSLLVDAGGDVIIGASVHASATRLDGAGGEISVSAGNDVRIAGAAVMESNGGRAGEFAGDGGTQFYSAGRNVLVSSSVVLQANGSRPDGGGGLVEIDAAVAITVAGSIDTSASVAIGSGGAVVIDGCDITMVTGGSIVSGGDGGDNEIAGRGAIVMQAGSELRANRSTGSNRIVFGNADREPQLGGTIVPAAEVTFDAALGPCSVPPTTLTTLPTTTTLVTTTVPTTTTLVTTTTVFFPPGCGNGVVDATEECDGGGAQWRIGTACRINCTLLDCGDPDDSGGLAARDALFILRCAVGTAECANCICDVDQTGGPPKAGDALRVLRVAVGQPLEIACSPCL